MSEKDSYARAKTEAHPIMIWLRVTVTMAGLGAIALSLYIAFLFKPIADVSLLHCVNVIKEEAKLTEWSAALDFERQKLDEEALKKSK